MPIHTKSVCIIFPDKKFGSIHLIKNIYQWIDLTDQFRGIGLVTVAKMTDEFTIQIEIWSDFYKKVDIPKLQEQAMELINERSEIVSYYTTTRPFDKYRGTSVNPKRYRK